MEEIWDLLDSNANKIGKTIIKGEEIPDGFFHQGADVWILNSENEILIQKRSPQKKRFPNVWGMTGGSTLIGENTIQTIEREVFEELGIRINIKDLQFIRKYNVGDVFLDTYLLKQDINLDDIVMQEEEVCEVKWATFDEVDDLVKNGKFIDNRWNFVREFIKKIVK